MVFGYLLGAGVGLVGGITAGVYALGYLPFLKAGESYKALNITADIDPAVPHKAAPDKISEAHRDLLKFTPPWTKWPDYHTVTWLNTIVRVVWPTYRKMLPDMVQEIAKAQLEAVYKQVPGGLLERLDIDIVDIGTKPLQFGGFRNFVTGDDEIIIEAPLLWGSDMKVRVTAHLKLGAFTVAIPAEVSNVQCRGQARITIKPLVETLPCVGAITVSLIDDPYVDANVSLLDSPDLLALPLVYDAMHLGVKMVAGQLMGYPNSMTFPIMPNSGLPPEPVGMLKVTVLRAKGLPSTLTDKIDPFVKLMVRENRPMKTSVVDNCNHPEWNETYDFVVDDAAAQCLTMLVYDEDLVKDNRVCEAEVPFKNAQFMRIPRRAVHMKVPLFKSRQLSIAEAAGKAPFQVAGALGGGAVKTSAAAVNAIEKGIEKGIGAAGVVGGKVANKMLGLKDKKSAPVHAPVFAAPHHEKAGEAHEGQVPEEHAADPKRQREAMKRKMHAVNALKSRKPAGEIEVEITFLPFKTAPKGDADPGKAEKVLDPLKARTVIPRLPSEKGPQPDSYGVLTVDVISLWRLEAESGQPDCYVMITLFDPITQKTETQRTETFPNDESPRIGAVYDFCNFSAKSVLSVQVMDRTSISEGLSHLNVKALVGKQKDKKLGRLTMDIKGVVVNGRVKDTYPLRDAKQGDVELKMTWTGIDLDQPERLSSVQQGGLDELFHRGGK